jgi:NTP pyrophosphatase (non-canonical NTP hydrolase)
MAPREPVAADRINLLQQRLREFARVRDWEKFHTPKNLTIAVAAEAGELAAVLQWTDPTDDLEHAMPQLTDEIADVFIYLLRLADVMGVDLAAAAEEKIERNEQRFPIRRGEG